MPVVCPLVLQHSCIIDKFGPSRLNNVPYFLCSEEQEELEEAETAEQAQEEELADEDNHEAGEAHEAQDGDQAQEEKEEDAEEDEGAAEHAERDAAEGGVTVRIGSWSCVLGIAEACRSSASTTSASALSETQLLSLRDLPMFACIVF